MRNVFYGTFWFIVYIFLSVIPVLILLVGDTLPGRGILREFSVALGFIGLSMLGWQFLLTGKFSRISSPYGIDIVYHFHRYVTIIAFLFVLLHPILLIISSPDTILLLNPFGPNLWAATGVWSLIFFIIIIITSIYRLQLKLNYEVWRSVHSVASVLAVVLAVYHIVGVGYYLREPIKIWLWILISAIWILALIYIRLVKPLIMLKHPYIVTEVIKEKGKSWTLVLKPDGHKGIKFKPGQFGWLILGKSPFAVREHPFSFSSSSMNFDSIEMTIKELGDFTSKIGLTKTGTRAYIDGAYGTFTIDDDISPGFVFIAGGVGIAPIMSMIRTMRDRFDKRPVFLFYGAKNWDEITFREEIESIKKEINIKVVYVLEETSEDWSGEKGFITSNIIAKHLPVERFNYEYFVCGPLPMQKAIKTALNEMGVPLDKVKSESFNFV
jgi:predicted ferric reductase